MHTGSSLIYTYPTGIKMIKKARYYPTSDTSDFSDSKQVDRATRHQVKSGIYNAFLMFGTNHIQRSQLPTANWSNHLRKGTFSCQNQNTSIRGPTSSSFRLHDDESSCLIYYTHCFKGREITRHTDNALAKYVRRFCRGLGAHWGEMTYFLSRVN